METNATQQEILLLKNTSFSQKELFERDVLENARNLSPDEQLEAACWNGLLEAMLPEIVDTSEGGKSLYLWQIMQSKAFLNIELCECPQTVDVHYSINPYAVLTTACYE